MRTLVSLFRFLIALGALTALTIVGLYLFVPPNTRPEDGPADAILSVRRPVVGFLRDVGVLSDGLPVLFGDPLLPTVATTTIFPPTTNPLDAGEDGVVVEEITVRREPVYRGVLWPVGDRILYKNEFFSEDRHDIASLRLCYEAGGRHVVAGEGTVENGLVDRSGRWVSVRGFVPRTAAAYWIESVRPDGTVEEGDRWGRASVETVK